MGSTSYWMNFLRACLWITAATAVIGPPIYLWATNFCFTDWRYVSKQEMCETAFATVRAAWRTPQDRCFIHTGGFTAFNAELGLFSPNLPKSYTAHHSILFNTCGRIIKVH
jgi:hypothetical protein